MLLIEFLGGLFVFIILSILVISALNADNNRAKQEEELRRIGRIFRGEDESKTLSDNDIKNLKQQFSDDDVEKIARLLKDV